MTEREQLQWLIEGIQSSVQKSEVGCYESLEYYLSYPVIYDFALDKNLDLWEKFNQALKNHYMLKEGEEAFKIFDRPNMVAQGYWWYDPRNWQ